MDQETIRIEIYQEFLALGGKFDKDESMNGTEEEYNEDKIDIIFEGLMNLRDNNFPKYLQVLKTLLIDTFCFFRIF